MISDCATEAVVRYLIGGGGGGNWPGVTTADVAAVHLTSNFPSNLCACTGTLMTVQKLRLLYHRHRRLNWKTSGLVL